MSHLEIQIKLAGSKSWMSNLATWIYRHRLPLSTWQCGDGRWEGVKVREEGGGKEREGNGRVWENTKIKEDGYKTYKAHHLHSPPSPPSHTTLAWLICHWVNERTVMWNDISVQTVLTVSMKLLLQRGGQSRPIFYSSTSPKPWSLEGVTTAERILGFPRSSTQSPYTKSHTN